MKPYERREFLQVYDQKEPDKILAWLNKFRYKLYAKQHGHPYYGWDNEPDLSNEKYQAFRENMHSSMHGLSKQKIEKQIALKGDYFQKQNPFHFQPSPRNLSNENSSYSSTVSTDSDDESTSESAPQSPRNVAKRPYSGNDFQPFKRSKK